METNFDNNELELMRKQMNILKEKLSKQEVINERLMRESMRHRMSWMNKFVWTEIILLPFCFLVIGLFAWFLRLSWWFVAYCVVLLLLDIFCDFKFSRIRPKDWMECDLLGMSHHLARMNRLRVVQTAVASASMFVAVAWAYFGADIPANFFENLSEPMASGVRGAIYGGCIGSVIGIFIAVWVVRKMNKDSNKMINEINKMTKL